MCPKLTVCLYGDHSRCRPLAVAGPTRQAYVARLNSDEVVNGLSIRSASPQHPSNFCQIVVIFIRERSCVFVRPLLIGPKQTIWSQKVQPISRKWDSFTFGGVGRGTIESILFSWKSYLSLASPLRAHCGRWWKLLAKSGLLSPSRRPEKVLQNVFTATSIALLVWGILRYLVRAFSLWPMLGMPEVSLCESCHSVVTCAPDLQRRSLSRFSGPQPFARSPCSPPVSRLPLSPSLVSGGSSSDSARTFSTPPHRINVPLWSDLSGDRQTLRVKWQRSEST